MIGVRGPSPRPKIDVIISCRERAGGAGSDAKVASSMEPKAFLTTSSEYKVYMAKFTKLTKVRRNENEQFSRHRSALGSVVEALKAKFEGRIERILFWSAMSQSETETRESAARGACGTLQRSLKASCGIIYYHYHDHHSY